MLENVYEGLNAHDGEVVFCSQVIERKRKPGSHFRDAFQSLSSFRSLCYISVNWITSKTIAGVNIGQLNEVTFWAAVVVIKAPPASPIKCFNQCEPSEETSLYEAPTLAHVNCFLPLYLYTIH